MRWIKSFLALASFAIAADNVTIIYPDMGPPANATVSIGGVGSDNRTTYVVPPDPTDTVNQQTFTFIEGPTDFVVPSQVVTVTASGTTHTISVVESCGVTDSQANCLATIVVDGQTLTKGSATLTLSATTVVVDAVGTTNLTTQASPTPTGDSISAYSISSTLCLGLFISLTLVML